MKLVSSSMCDKMKLIFRETSAQLLNSSKPATNLPIPLTPQGKGGCISQATTKANLSVPLKQRKPHKQYIIG